MVTGRSLAGLVVIGAVIAGCGGSNGPTTGASGSAGTSPAATPSAVPSPAAKPTSTLVPTPTPVPTPATFSLNSQVWWGGYVITVTGGTFDPLKHKLNIDATFQNTSTQQTELGQLGNATKIVWNGQFLTGSTTYGAVPIGATAKGQIQTVTPADFVVADAVLTFGQPDEHHALVPLNGGPATSDKPSILTVTGKVTMGTYVTFTITSAMLVPASCSGYPDRIKYGALKANLVSIVLWGTATTTDPLNYGSIDQGYVLAPDGTTSTSNPAVSMSLTPKQTLRDQGMCFAVPAPGSGSYTLTMHEGRSKANGTLVFQVP